MPPDARSASYASGRRITSAAPFSGTCEGAFTSPRLQAPHGRFCINAAQGAPRRVLHQRGSRRPTGAFTSPRLQAPHGRFYINTSNRAGLATTAESARAHGPSGSARPLFSLIAVGRRELDPNTLVVVGAPASGGRGGD